MISRRRSEAAGFVAAGMLAPHAEGLSGNLLALGQRSLELVPSWLQQVEADSDLDCGHRPCGIVVPFRSEQERDAFPTAGCGVALNRDALEREIPGIAAGWSTGLLFEQDGQIDNRRRLMRALERACSNLGVQFEEGAEVQSLQAAMAKDFCKRSACGGLTANSSSSPASRPCSAVAPGADNCCRSCRSFRSKGRCSPLQAAASSSGRVLFGPGTYLVPREDGSWWWEPPANQRPASAKG